MDEKIRILVAEDDLTTRIMVKGMLESLGCQVDEACTGDEAWEKIENNNFAMLISDWIMPGLSGIELCQKIKDLKKEDFLYIILLTAKSEVASLKQALDAGANDFIAKPFDRNELEARVRAGIRIVMLEKQLAERVRELEKAKSSIEKANKRMKKDLIAAARIQASLLPASLPSFPECNFEWVYKPLEELAGDCLNAFNLDDENIGFYVLDVTGHGVQPALLSVSLSRVLSPVFLNANILMRNGRLLSPAELLGELSRLFPIDFDNFLCFSMFYGVINRKTLELKYALGAHPQPLLQRAGRAPFFLEGGGFPIGSFEDIPYKEFSFQLKKNDRLFVFTDGLSEARNEKGQQFGKTALSKLVSSLGYLPLRQVLDRLIIENDHWLATNRIGDDITILALEIK
ncbi:MAG: SpoIIE family protein phosphatase [Candidatus Riflebacteria bacterium]|nr:SpoIIE family protein phosphatase [Candidatus Riflebacteria bacterium]